MHAYPIRSVCHANEPYRFRSLQTTPPRFEKVSNAKLKDSSQKGAILATLF